MKLYIIDTACANLASLKFSLERLGYKAEVSREIKELEKADKLFFTGRWHGGYGDAKFRKF